MVFELLRARLVPSTSRGLRELAPAFVGAGARAQAAPCRDGPARPGPRTNRDGQR